MGDAAREEHHAAADDVGSDHSARYARQHARRERVRKVAVLDQVAEKSHVFLIIARKFTLFIGKASSFRAVFVISCRKNTNPCNLAESIFIPWAASSIFSESSTLAREFERGGFVRVAPTAEADICVINSCSVTEHADKKCRNLIRKLHRRNPEAIIAVTGCYAQLKPQEIAAIEGVDIVLSNNDKGGVI